jgi:hypothetical protein
MQCDSCLLSFFWRGRAVSAPMIQDVESIVDQDAGCE